MAFYIQQLAYPSEPVKLTLDSSFDDLFNDFINFDKIQSEPKDSGRLESIYSFNHHDEAAPASKYGVDTCAMPSDSSSSDESFEDRLSSALRNYIDRDEAALSLPHLVTDAPSYASHRPAAGAQCPSEHLSLASSSFACWPSAASPLSSPTAAAAATAQILPFTTPLDTFLPSPPRSPTTPPLLPLADRFTTLTIRKNRRSPPCSPSRVQKSPRKLNTSPTMAAAAYRQAQSAAWERRLAATDSQHLNIRGQPDLQFLSPPPSASYRTVNFPKMEYPHMERPDTPLPTGYGGHPNTPLESPFFEGRSTSSSSLDDFEPSYQAVPSQRVAGTASMELCMPITSLPSDYEADIPRIDGGLWSSDSSFEAQPSVSHGQPIMQSMRPSALGLGISGMENEATNAGAPPSEVHRTMQPVSINHNGMLCLPQQSSRGALTGAPPTPNMLSPASLLRVASIDREEAGFAASALSKSPTLVSPVPMPPPFNPNQRWSQPNLHTSPRSYHSQLSMAGPLPHQRFQGPIPQQQQQQHKPTTRSPQPYPSSSSCRLEAPPPHHHHQQHRRSKSSGSHMRRKSAGSSSKSPRHASLGFVNFTPSDSEKLLGGVAPSGSSKTKARREREAAEKRRKQFEAAKMAVERAGGDVGEFVRGNLNVLEF